jgi:D-alanyl-D-alanine carboxypeptidase-like protein
MKDVHRRLAHLLVMSVALVACMNAGATDLSGAPAAARSPAFEGSVRWIDQELREKLIGRTWHPGCPVLIRDLRLVTVSYWTFGDRVKQGPFIINETVADDVLGVFHQLFDAHFPIQKIALASKWRPPRPSDWFSTKNVSASFNCRPVTGQTSGFSQHAYGWAIDINPTQNPYVTGDGEVLREACLPYVDRTQHLPGMIHRHDVVARSFAAIGWGWGGDWDSLKDYMHFSLTGT